MIDIRGLWEHFPIATAILCVGGIICIISSFIENKNDASDKVNGSDV